MTPKQIYDYEVTGALVRSGAIRREPKTRRVARDWVKIIALAALLISLFAIVGTVEAWGTTGGN